MLFEYEPPENLDRKLDIYGCGGFERTSFWCDATKLAHKRQIKLYRKEKDIRRT